MRHLGMELKAKEFFLVMLDDCVVGVLRRGDRGKAGRQVGQLVAVRVPHLEGPWQVAKERAGQVLDLQGPFAVFALLAPSTFRQEVREELDAVADAQDGNAQAKMPWSGLGALGA